MADCTAAKTNKKGRQIMRLVLKFLKPHWKLCVVTVLLLIIDVAGALYIPTLAAEILNEGTSGSTGAGKTTLINLLMRFYEINSGRITVDGVPTTDLTRSGLRQNFGMVLQDTWLFGGTVAENIAYGKANATREEIVEAAKAAKVNYFIRTMPKGYDTMLDNEASNLSAGQKQLLTIARVFLCNPPILILDEATSSVDTRTEVEIGKAMKKLMKGRRFLRVSPYIHENNIQSG